MASRPDFRRPTSSFTASSGPGSSSSRSSPAMAYAISAGWAWPKAARWRPVAGPPSPFLAYAGFLFVPLAHGGVIQPSCAALGGLALATLVLKEKLPARRAAGAAVIVAGLAVIGAEALATIGTHGLVGDLSFVTAGLMFAGFATL